MAIVEVSIVPMGTGTISVSEYVARALRTIENRDTLSYQLTPMGTILQGDLDEILDVIRVMHESAFDKKVQRVYTRIVIDDRRDKPATMAGKVQSVQSKLQES